MKISQITGFNCRFNSNFASFVKFNKAANTINLNQIQDTVHFTGKKEDAAKARYETIVKENADDSRYKEVPLHTEDVEFLLDLDDDDFKRIITEPVKYTDCAGRNLEATIFFYTDGLATEKLLNKLNDKKAAFDILKVGKDWCGTTALHTAAYASDPIKAESILSAVNPDDMKTLMKIEEIDDDAFSTAISQYDEATLDVFKRYFNKIYKVKYE